MTKQIKTDYYTPRFFYGPWGIIFYLFLQKQIYKLQYVHIICIVICHKYDIIFMTIVRKVVYVMALSCFSKIKTYMESKPKGTVFATSDFKSFGTYDAIRKALSRLAEDGICLRILPSIYYCPAYSNLFNCFVRPDPYEVAFALARNYGWKIAPDPITAQNSIGLSTQVPASMFYLSTGPTRTYNIPGSVVQFKQCRSKYLSQMSFESALIISALSKWNRETLKPSDLREIARHLYPAERKTLVEEVHFAPKWMAPYLNEIGTFKGEAIYLQDSLLNKNHIREEEETVVMSDNILSINDIQKRSKDIFNSNDFVEKVFLFGSYARGEATKHSDLDFMVVLNRDAHFEFFGLYDLLQDQFGKSVDVIREEEAYRIMPKTIERDKVLIYERQN